MNNIERKEKKYILNIQEAKKIERNIEKIMCIDKYSGASGYIVRTLYFDTLNNNDFEDKLSGIEVRRKIRLRIYGDDYNYAILELKQKQGENQLKRRAILEKKDAIELTKQNYSCLLKYKDAFLAECYSLMNMYCYRPKAIVQYNRKPYIMNDNKIRITFDSNIVGTEANYNIFDRNLNLYHLFEYDKVILEVKYNGFLLSYIKDILNSVNYSENSISKYCLSRKITQNYIY